VHVQHPTLLLPKKENQSTLPGLDGQGNAQSLQELGHHPNGCNQVGTFISLIVDITKKL
jgi:hypothetical protein